MDNQRIDHVGFIRSGVADICIWHPDGSEIVCSTLSRGDFFGELACLTDRKPLVRIICRESVTAYIQAYEDFIRCLDNYHSLERFFLQSAMQKLRSIYHRPHEAPVPPPLDQLPKPIAKVIRYMERKLADPLNLEDVARIAGMSRYTFSRSFKSAVGVAFKEYLNQIRVREAKNLISSGELNVTEACFAAGFNDVAYFSRVFRKIEGKSPSKYKNMVSVA